MGRLFWKFFFALLLAQTLSVLGVGLLIGLHNREFMQAGESRRPTTAADAAKGEQAPPSAESRPSGLPGVRMQPEYLYDPVDGPEPRHLIPRLPLLSGLAASLIFAALLAWYFAKPIRSLSHAFDAVAQGDLRVRLSAEMGGRRDELADLGRDFDGMAQRLQSLMDGQRRLFHDVSHELRSPLTRMQVAIGLARQQPERGEQALARVERESVRMDQLVTELLTLARLESGMSDSRHEALALAEFVGDIVEDSRVEAEVKHCGLRLDMEIVSADGTNRASSDEPEADEVWVRGSPELLRRGVENVLRNAIRHSPEGGEVIVTIHEGGAARVEISILDQGDGVAESELQQIFTPFFRGADAGGAKGHGLGLAIAQRVVTMHDGSIFARNGDGGGFNVVIDLPRISAPAGAPQ